MLKNFKHVNKINYLLRTFKDNFNINMFVKTNAVIMNYSQKKKMTEFMMIQKNKIDIILIIQKFKYVIYHTELSLKFIN